MAGDGGEAPGAVALGHDGGALLLDAGQLEAPPQQLSHRRHRGSAGCDGAEVAEHGHTHRRGVEPGSVGADHIAGGASSPTLPDASEAVDEEVVADVVPAVDVHVVRLDPPQHGRHLGRGVVVRAHRVVHEAHLQLGRDGGGGLGLSGAPRRPQRDRRRSRLAVAGGREHDLARRRRPPVAHQVHLYVVDALGHVDLVAVGAVDPHRLAHYPGSGALGRAGVRGVGTLGLELAPLAPAAVDAHPPPHVIAPPAGPAHPQQVEGGEVGPLGGDVDALAHLALDVGGQGLALGGRRAGGRHCRRAERGQRGRRRG